MCEIWLKHTKEKEEEVKSRNMMKQGQGLEVFSSMCPLPLVTFFFSLLLRG